MIDSCYTRYLLLPSTGLVEFKAPTAGMFVWMKLVGVTDSFKLITDLATTAKVLFVPGAAFVPGSPASGWVRAAFSTASPDQIDTALQRLGAALRQHRKLE